MSKYHVECSPISNIIYAGEVKANGKEWASKSDVTDEALEAVRDHLYELLKKGEPSGYEWALKAGGKVVLTLKKEDEKC